MQQTIIYVLFFIGLILIIRGGDRFVESSSFIASALNVPKFIIGATIVSIATTLPEMIVSIQATVKGNVDMATGNAIGSVTANTALILGFFIICSPFKIKRKEFAPKSIIMLSCAVVMMLGCVFTPKKLLQFENEENLYYTLLPIGAIGLTILFIIFFTENYLTMKKAKENTVLPETDVIPNDAGQAKKVWAKYIAYFVLGTAGIVFGADLLVKYGTLIAQNLGVPQRVISVIAIAIGTSLPELATAISALKKKAGAISVGNILGANIIDLALILPACSIVSYSKGSGALAVSVSSINIDLIICIAAISIAVIPTLITKKFSRVQGIIMFAGYMAYAIWVVFCK